MKNHRQLLRRMGYIRDQEGIMNRYIREKMHWDQHLVKTREFINTSFMDKSIESVAVLGSGWLLDIPLMDMKERFKHIFLVDIFHPPQIRKKVEAMENVELVEKDISGGVVNQLWQIIRKKGSTNTNSLLEEILLTPPLSHIQPDAFLSINLLNQLDIILCDFLKKHGYFQQESSDHFRSVIQAFHLEWITRTPGCLVTDTIEINKDRRGNETFKSLLYTDLPKGLRTRGWNWFFDSHGFYHQGNRTRMEVQAVEWS